MKILLVFGSLLGKTKRLSVLLGQNLKKQGLDIKVKDVRNTHITELNDFDLVILGCSTWDDGMLQFDFRPFHVELMKAKLQSKQFAIFAVGGHRYPHFCFAADILEKTVVMIKGELLVPTLRLDIDHDEPADKMDKEALEWVDSIAKKILNS